MNPKASTEESPEIERDLENLQYVANRIDEMIKSQQSMDLADSVSVSYANTKHCTMLQNIFLYMLEYKIIDEELHKSLTSVLKSIEDDVEFFNEKVRPVFEKGDDFLVILSKREIHAQVRQINNCLWILNSLVTIFIRRLKAKIGDKVKLKRLGEKLREQIEQQKKKSEEQISKYVA